MGCWIFRSVVCPRFIFAVHPKTIGSELSGQSAMLVQNIDGNSFLWKLCPDRAPGFSLAGEFAMP